MNGPSVIMPTGNRILEDLHICSFTLLKSVQQSPMTEVGINVKIHLTASFLTRLSNNYLVP